MTARFRASRSRSEAAIDARSCLPASELTAKDLTHRAGGEKSEKAILGRWRIFVARGGRSVRGRCFRLLIDDAATGDGHFYFPRKQVARLHSIQDGCVRH